MTPERNTVEREVRNYPEQPPVIPHSIEGYQVDSTATSACPATRARAPAKSQAPMVSITHFMDRDGQFLASVSPRRYFCTQCHVPQHDVKAPVENEFVDVDTLLDAAPQPGGARAMTTRRRAASAALVAAQGCASAGRCGTCCFGRARVQPRRRW